MLSENDVKEELSYAYVHAIATHVGYSTEYIRKDRDSTDLRICGRGFLTSDSIYTSPSLEIQVKATSQEFISNEIPFPLSMKNYTDLSGHSMTPKILVVILLPHGTREWVNCKPEHLILHGQAYWLSLAGYDACENETSKTVKIPKKNIFNDISLKKMMIAASKRERITNES